MLEKNTDRLFWTLTSIIVGALLLTISVKAFPSVAETAISPITGIVKQADTVGHKSNDTANKAFSDANNFGKPIDPYAQAKANAVEASTQGITATDNGDGTATITSYTGFNNNGSSWNIPSFIKVNGNLLKVTTLGNANAYSDITNQAGALSNVTIPNTVTTINSYAFAFEGLNSITIPNSVNSIASNAFGSNSISSVNVPNSVTSLDPQAFDSSVTINRN